MHLDPWFRLLLYFVVVGVGFAWLAVTIVYAAVLVGRVARWLLDVPMPTKGR